MRLTEREKIDLMAMSIIFKPSKNYMIACKNKNEFNRTVTKVRRRVEEIINYESNNRKSKS